eukprot:COSAG01_NODE_6683_length_3545_cov_2.152351_3_plen_68_part_00
MCVMRACVFRMQPPPSRGPGSRRACNEARGARIQGGTQGKIQLPQGSCGGGSGMIGVLLRFGLGHLR